MRSAWLGVVMAALVASPSEAKPKKVPGKGFWKVLVKPGAKWVLKDRIAEQVHEPPRTLTIETYDVRKVGTADVARLRWTLGEGPDADHEALKFTHAGPITQLAVTDAGLYMMWASYDDAKVAEVLQGKPARSDPPKAYKGTKLNEGRYLTIDDDGIVCLGQGPAPGDPECEDTCDGSVCVSATAGIVSLMGTWTPGVTEFTAK